MSETACLRQSTWNCAEIRRKVQLVKTPITALISIAVLGVCMPCTAAAQNQRQLEQKYPKLNAYVVRPNILLTARYATDGQVCEMVLETRRWTGEGQIVVMSALSEEETIRVVEEVVPESDRGRKLKTPLGSAVSGGSRTTRYTYENITIDFVGPWSNSHPDMVVGYMVALVQWRNRSCK